MSDRGRPGRVVLMFALFLASAGCASSGVAMGYDTSADNGKTGFTWIARGQDPASWSTVEKAFRQELSPDPPTAPGSHEMVCGHKFIQRIGVCNGSALVLIAERGEKSDPPELDSLVAFTYDLGTSRKAKVMPSNGFLYWRYAGLARFVRSPVPDVVFTHDDCIECEAVEQLSSFRYDSKDKEWSVRVWPPDGTDLFIGGAIRVEPPHTHETTCLFSIRDFNGDRLDDIAIWCRDRDVIHGVEKDNVALYTVQGDVPARTSPEGALLKTIKSELCRKAPGSPLCASGK